MESSAAWMGKVDGNVFVERLWSSVKHEDVNLRAYETPARLRADLPHYFMFYNTERGHQALSLQTTDAVYFVQTQIEIAAE